MLRSAKLKYANIWCDGWITWLRFGDGGVCEAHPHQEPHYFVIAHRLGYGDDIISYCYEHEFCHEFFNEFLYDRKSPLLVSLAQGSPLAGPVAVQEELSVMAVQRWLRANERPIVAGIDWDMFKTEALRLLHPTKPAAAASHLRGL